MNNDTQLLVGLLEDFLGRPKAHYPNKGQISFDCPTCSHEIKGLDEGDGKGNLEINYHKGVFKCWACSETHSTHGHINKIFYKWAKPSHRKMWDAVSPEEFKSKTKKSQVQPGPGGTRSAKSRAGGNRGR